MATTRNKKSRILFGIPYMGSKNGICKEILRVLPSGKRFVDLFGGGMAMTHCAILSKKYENFLYSDSNPLIVNLLKDAISGKYNYKVFKPEFVTREQFDREKENNGYIKYIWSFGNNGQVYLFGKEIEQMKRIGHNVVVFGKFDPILNKIAPNLRQYIKSQDIYSRRLELQQYAKVNIKIRKEFLRHQQLQSLERLQQVEQLERLERLQQLERLERLQQLERLELKVMSYQDYEWQEGDIVYLDPPYENTAEYSGGFNHKEFYEWVATRPYQVFFSSYNNISDKRFRMIWATEKHQLLKGGCGKVVYECLYTNK